jgi:ABC-2 type transport system permease protein
VNMKRISVIFRKDLKEVKESKQLWIPMIIVPIIMVIVLPSLVILIPSSGNLVSSSQEFLDNFIDKMPPSLSSQIIDLTDKQRQIYLMIVLFFAPFFLIVPLMFSSIIGANSFAGEKERKTIEGILYTPITDEELLAGKILSAFIPSVIIAWICFIAYTLIVNILAYPTFQRIFFPNLLWIVLMIWVVPAISFFGLGVTVLVSAKVRGFQEAQQLGGTVVLPILAIIFLQVFGVIYLSTGFAGLLGLVFWIIDYILIRLGAKAFKREEVITKLS